jgi:hypothetical protein
VGVNIRCQVILSSMDQHFQQCGSKALAKRLAYIRHAVLKEELAAALIGCMPLYKRLDVAFAGVSAR